MSTYDTWTQEAICPGRVLTRAELERHQLQSWNALLAHVTAHSVFYKNYPHHLECLEEVNRLPTLTAADITQSGSRMLCVSQSEIDRVLTVESSGTTGKPKRLFFKKEDLEATVDFYAQGYLELIQPGDGVLVLYPHSREYSVGRLVGKGLEKMGARPVYCLPNAPFAEMCRLIQAEQVCSISGLPTTVFSLARYCAAFGYDVKIKSLMICGDYFSPYVRQELERIWHCAVFDHYGMAESGLGMALECPCHNGMHLWERDMYVEILDASGQPLPDGTWGEITLTTLARRGQPLLRYRTGDRGRILPGACGCGSILRRLDRIGGRIAEEAKPLSIHTLDEVIFPLSADIIDYTAQQMADGLHLDIVGRVSGAALLPTIRAQFPNATLTVYEPEQANPLCAGKRAFRNEPLDCMWGIR